ncbi:MAG: hypothetical protein ACI82S_001823 [Patiriisocius sp.]
MTLACVPFSAQKKKAAASKETIMSLCAVFEVRQSELIKLDEEKYQPVTV